MDPAKSTVARDIPSPTPSEVLAASANHDDPTTNVLQNRGTRPVLSELGWPRVRGYKILSVIGSGGMGVVYKARHHALRRTVALKTIRAAALSDMQFRERFYAEAEAIARLQHPNIIQLFEIGTLEPLPGEVLPSPFIALEFVEGCSLSQRSEKPQSAQDAARIVEKLARAVQAAHQLGVIHRDLKPANVLLTLDGEPKIADFGLAKQIGTERNAEGRFLTQAGIVMGTPEYMAPEQVTGATPTPAIDVYALGVILYEQLTGRVPFQGSSPVETMTLVQQQEPVSPRRLQPALSRDLETICLKCLEKEPGKRYASALALADDLRRFLDNRPILARRVSEIERFGRWCKRNPLVAALLAGVVGIFLVAFVLVSWSYWRAETARQDEAWQRHEAQRKGESERWERYRANLIAAASAFENHNASNARRMLDAAPQEYRNWEWRHFHSRLDRARQVVRIHKGLSGQSLMMPDGRRVFLVDQDYQVHVWDLLARKEVHALPLTGIRSEVNISPDGQSVAYGTTEHTVVLKDVATAQVRTVLRGHNGPVVCYLFSANSRRVVTSSEDQTCRVWDASTGQLLGRVQTPGVAPYLYAVDPSGRWIVVGSMNEPTLRVWDLEAEKQTATLLGHEQGVHSVCFNRTGDKFVSVEAFPTNKLRLWETKSGRLLHEMLGHANSVTHVAFCADGTRLASCSRDQSVRLWDVLTGQPLATLKGHLDRVNWVAFSPDGKRVASASNDHTIRLWDAMTGEALAVLYGHTAEVFNVIFSADGRHLVSASLDRTIRTWDARAVEANGTLRGHTSFVYGVSFHPDGERIASASWDGSVRIWSATTGEQLKLLDHGEKAIVTSVAFHPSGTMLVSRSRDSVRLFDIASGRELHRWDEPVHSWHDTRLVFNRQGNRLATGCINHVIRIWDVETRSEVALLRGHTNEIRDLAFSPDGRWLASGGDDGDCRIKIWDIERQQAVHDLVGHTQGVFALAFNNDGTLLASGSVDGTVRLWETATWQEVAVLKHGTRVYGVAFTADGTRLACACADNSIRFWDTRTHQEVAELRGHEAYVHQIAFSPDGTRLVSASGDNSVRVWDTLLAQERLSSKMAQGGR